MLRRAALPAVGLLLVLFPTVAAQGTGTLELAVLPPVGMVKPEVESPSFVAQVTAPCEAILARASPAVPPDPVLVTLWFEIGEGVVVTGPASIPVDPQACLAGASSTVRAEAILQLSVPRTAPGLRPLPAVGYARLEEAGPAAPAMTAQPVPFTVTADYFAQSQAIVPSKLRQCKPGGHAEYDVEVVNFGNARTQYIFEVAGRPSGKWDIVVPEPLVLDRAAGEDGTSQTVTLRVACTGLNSEGAFQVVVRSAAFDDPTKQGDPLTVNVLARSRGAVPVPGPGVPLALGLLAAAFLARRRA